MAFNLIAAGDWCFRVRRPPGNYNALGADRADARCPGGRRRVRAARAAPRLYARARAPRRHGSEWPRGDRPRLDGPLRRHPARRGARGQPRRLWVWPHAATAAQRDAIIMLTGTGQRGRRGPLAWSREPTTTSPRPFGPADVRSRTRALLRRAGFARWATTCWRSPPWCSTARPGRYGFVTGRSPQRSRRSRCSKR